MRRALVGLLIGGALASAACSVPDRSEVRSRCPCVDGWVCCAALDVCIPEGDASCPSGEGPAKLRILSVEPREGPVREATPIELVVGVEDPPPEGLVVEVGGRRCAGAAWGAALSAGERRVSCVVPPGALDVSVADVTVSALGAGRAISLGAFRYVLDAFVDVVERAELGDPTTGSNVSIADLDGDGLLDLWFSDGEGRGGDGVLVGRGAMTFGEPAVAAVEPRPGLHWAALPGDFTGDGVVDVLVAWVGQPPTLLAGDGVGHLRAGLRTVSSTAGEELRLAVTDLDGDADLDALGCRFLGGNAVALVNDGSGNLRRRDFAVNLPRCETIAAADFDGDGDVDLATCRERVVILANERDGTGRRVLVDRTAEVLAPLGGAAYALNPICRELQWVDVDADGDLDLAFTRSAWDRRGVTLLENVPAASGGGRQLRAFPELDRGGVIWPRNDRIAGTTLGGGVRSMAWVDVDADGDVDLLLDSPFTTCTGQPLLYRSRFADGPAGFTSELLEAVHPLYATTGMTVADLDGDGDLDVLTQTWSSQQSPSCNHDPSVATSPLRPGRALLRGNAAENAGTTGAAKGRIVTVRAREVRGDPASSAPKLDAVGVAVEVDLDGPEDAPDFAPGAGKLEIAIVGGAASSTGIGPPVASIAVGAGRVWTRARFPDGSVARTRIDADVTSTIIDSCPGTQVTMEETRVCRPCALEPPCPH